MPLNPPRAAPGLCCAARAVRDKSTPESWSAKDAPGGTVSPSPGTDMLQGSKRGDSHGDADRGHPSSRQCTHKGAHSHLPAHPALGTASPPGTVTHSLPMVPTAGEILTP